MGCLGHGVGLEDEHADALDRASEVLLGDKGGAFDPRPFDTEGSEWADMAFEAVQARLAEPADAEEGWPYQPGEEVEFEARMGTGDTLEGAGTVVKCLPDRRGVRVVVRLGEDHPERPGQYITMGLDDVSG